VVISEDSIMMLGLVSVENLYTLDVKEMLTILTHGRLVVTNVEMVCIL